MHKSVCCMLTAVAAIVYSAVLAQEKNAIIPRPLPQPVVRVPDLRAEEKPIAVEKTEKEVAADKFFRRVRASFVFTNPNHRVMQGEFEFPIPDEAFVCGYSLEINGSMVPGVVCEKEKARVAFENEVRKGVDPGIVEQVKGNLWRTRIFPLNPNTPRRAEVDYIAPAANASEGEIFERDGDNVFAATSQASQTPQTSQTFPSGWIFWDASLSRLDKTAADRKRLEEILPEKGSWKLVVFSNRPAAPVDVASRDELLKLVDAAVCDGGTDIASALALAPGDAPKLLFTDEVDTLGTNNDWENVPNLAIASRPPAPKRAVEVRKLSAEEAAKVKEAKESILLATVWASRRMTDLASQADARKDEFLALGRKYCVAGPGLSLIVLETLQQYLDHKIEPPKSMSFHDEWVKRRAADDDPIAEKRARARFEAQLLRYWEERVKWWKNPIPERPKPRSGLFDRMISAVTHSSSSSRRAPVAMSAAANEESGAVAEDLEESPAVESAAPGAARSAPRALGAGRDGSAKAKMSRSSGIAGAPVPQTASIKLQPWNPKTPYIAELDKAKDAYATYLREREKYSSSPAFYLDCAGWFFKKGYREKAIRIISNLAEFKLEDAALWRSMGWRLREAGCHDEAVAAFRKALMLRGEEGQSRRDLALVLAERGKAKSANGDLEEALRLFRDAAFNSYSRRSARRGNDFQVAVISLEELNGLIAWCAANKAKIGDVSVPEFDAAYRRDLPVKLRIVLSWDADETDIDIHVLEPTGDEAFYKNRRTPRGGFVGEDVTTGYGPEEYIRKDADPGVYKVLANYYASHQTALTGATTVQATVYTDWAQAEEKMQILTLRLDKPKDKYPIGEVEIK